MPSTLLAAPYGTATVGQTWPRQPTIVSARQSWKTCLQNIGQRMNRAAILWMVSRSCRKVVGQPEQDRVVGHSDAASSDNPDDGMGSLYELHRQVRHYQCCSSEPH